MKGGNKLKKKLGVLILLIIIILLIFALIGMSFKVMKDEEKVANLEKKIEILQENKESIEQKVQHQKENQDIKQKEMINIMQKYLNDKNNQKQPPSYPDEKWFSSIYIYSIDEESLPIIIVYADTLEENYYKLEKKIVRLSAGSCPTKFTLKENTGKYIVINIEQPTDGDFYDEDLKKIFPADVLKKMEEGNLIPRMQTDIDRQALDYYGDYDLLWNYQLRKEK